MDRQVQILPVPGLPEIHHGADLARLVINRVQELGQDLRPGDILVLSSKVISKARGLRRMQARDEVIAEETVRVVAERQAGDRVTRIVESRAGPVMAAAGVDASNTGQEAGILTLPYRADLIAEELRGQFLLRAGLPKGTPVAVVLTDTAGRPWRRGQSDIAIGSAGLRALDDYQGRVDHDGKALSVTAMAIADEIAAAADLVKRKTQAVPVAIVRGLDSDLFAEGPHAGELVRTGPTDWFALGHAEAVRAALGVLPGSQLAAEVGIPSTGDESLLARVNRAAAVAAMRHSALTQVRSISDEAIEVVVTDDDRYALGLIVARLVTAVRGEGAEAFPSDPRRVTRTWQVVTRVVER